MRERLNQPNQRLMTSIEKLWRVGTTNEVFCSGYNAPTPFSVFCSGYNAPTPFSVFCSGYNAPTPFSVFCVQGE